MKRNKDSGKFIMVFLARISCQVMQHVLYIDDVDWNSEIDRELCSEIKSLTNDEDEEKDNAKEMDWFSSLLEEIQAIGWDEFEEAAPHLPSIVGS
ncbi:hypothetical protein Golob_024100 [Gossypium lobatum]|uniref:Uncharacterized protein n=1 Tax=Gossypium lobatum TaxID=34289 RepID=A0A7J8NJ10_9ROSI|nr:hypothetical protein [Gossypium lobatum]MBA0576814.1 hypothetical protein [Gossypium lobatum]